MTDDPKFLVVDRSNAFSWFSRGVVVPAPLMAKYRDDGMLGRGVLPIVGRAAIPAMASRARIPVALELDTDVRVVGEAQPLDPGGVTWVRGALSPRRITSVHVRDGAAAQEMGARAYRGFDASRLPIRVSPELFSSGESPALFDEAVSDEPFADSPPEQPPIDGRILLRREAVAGAVQCAGDPSLLDDIVRSASGDPIADLVSLMQGKGWLEEADDQTILGALLEEIHRQASIGTVVASSVIEALHASNELEGVRGLSSLLDRVGQILRGESEMRRFRGDGQRATKAMLLFLLRPEPEAIVTWDPEETGADEIVTLLSRLLSGFACRFGGLPETMRADVPGTDVLLDWVAGGLQPNDFEWPEPSPDVVEGPDEQPQEEVPSLMRELRAEVNSGSDARAVDVAKTMGWNECLWLSVVADAVDVRTQGRRVRAHFPIGADVAWHLDREAFESRLDGVDESAIASALAGKKPRRRSPGTRAKKAQPDAPVDDQVESV